MHNILPNFTYAPLLNAILISALCALLGYILAFKVRYFDRLANNPIVPPFIGVPTTFLALLIAFMSAAVWQNSSSAHAALQQERMALKKLQLLPVTSPEVRMKKDKYLHDYVAIVQREEWGMHDNRHPVKGAEDVLDSLLRYVFMNQKAASVYGVDSGSDAVRFVEELYSARDRRLSLGRMADYGYLSKWIIIYLLVFVACFNIAIVHRERPRAAVVALAVFGVCCVLVMSIVALYIHPYKGPNALRSSELSVIGMP